MYTETLVDSNFSDAEIQIFAVARAASDGLRRTFETHVAIAAAVRIARDHADAPGGTKKIRGMRFRKILDDHGLDHIATNDASQLLKVQSKLPEIRKWRAGLTPVQQIRWSSPQSVINRAPCFRPDGKIRGPASRAKPMSVNELLRMTGVSAAQLLFDRNPSKAWALRRALDELLDGGTAPRPRSGGWATAREREHAASAAA